MTGGPRPPARVDEAAVARVLDASVLRAAAAEIARPQRISATWVAAEGALADKSTEDGAATLTALTAAIDRARRAGPAAPAGELDRRRRRRAQSDPDADAGSAARASAHRDRRRRRLVGGCARGAGLRLSRGAQSDAACRSRFPTTTGAPQPMTGGRAGQCGTADGWMKLAYAALGLRSGLRRLSR